MKKTIAFLLVIVTVVALFAGCSAKETTAETENLPIVNVDETVLEDTESPAETETETVTEAETAMEKVTGTTPKAETTTKRTETTTKKSETTTKKQENTTQKSMSYEEMCLRIYELVNEERAKAGLEPLAYRSELQAGADLRAKELIQSFSHTRPNGSKCQTVFQDLGLSDNLYYAENITMASGIVYTPEMAMYSWMNSSGHKANILSENAYGIVVGRAESNGTTYWVQLFDWNGKKEDPTEHKHDWQAHYAERKVLVKEEWDEEGYWVDQCHEHATAFKCRDCDMKFGLTCKVCGYFYGYEQYGYEHGDDIGKSPTGNSAGYDAGKHMAETGHYVRPLGDETVLSGEAAFFDGVTAYIDLSYYVEGKHHVDTKYETETYIDYYYCSLNACGAKKDA